MSDRRKAEGVRYPALVTPPDEGGRRSVLAFTEDGVSSGVLGPVCEGKPVDTLVTLEGEAPFCTMEVVHGSIGKGPPKVNSEAFRAGWESIFGHKDVGQA